jgi:Co/Zn/Cd efflux system component
MACSCHDSCTPSTPANADTGGDPRWRRALWIALGVNLAFFVIELWAGLAAGSVSLLADAVDFAGDAANYGLSLAVLSMALVWRSRAAWVKGASMFGYGLLVLAKGVWVFSAGGVPDALTMGVVGFLALLANTGVAVMLYAWRNGDANMRSVWLCSRNDALSNLAVMLAALGVFGTHTAWPDLLVAAIMAGLALSAGWSVMGHARQELLGVTSASGMDINTGAGTSEPTRVSSPP